MIKKSLLIIFIVIAAFRIIDILLLNDPGHKRNIACKKINVQISKNDLITAMGTPEKIEKQENGLLYYYREAWLAAGPIRILLDNQESTVIGTKCNEDEEWIYFNKNK